MCVHKSFPNYYNSNNNSNGHKQTYISCTIIYNELIFNTNIEIESYHKMLFMLLVNILVCCILFHLVFDDVFQMLIFLLNKQKCCFNTFAMTHHSHHTFLCCFKLLRFTRVITVIRAKKYWSAGGQQRRFGL